MFFCSFSGDKIVVIRVNGAELVLKFLSHHFGEGGWIL